MEKLMQKLKAFRDARNWSKFHTPENLAKSIVIEAAELLEVFQWSDAVTDLEAIKEELADILSYCLLLADHYSFDIDTIVTEKIEKNKQKYPVDKAYGNAIKYDRLGKDDES